MQANGYEYAYPESWIRDRIRGIEVILPLNSHQQFQIRAAKMRESIDNYEHLIVLVDQITRYNFDAGLGS